ncbi:hypothetical protein ACTGJ9_034125 [Bradyrhizobium sp. RDM12]
MRPTAVYLPPKHLTTATKFDVVLWLHGFYVRDHEYLFRNDPARLREQVRDSGRDVVLIAPFLGYEYAVAGSFAGNYNVKDLASAKWGERYLDEILGALAKWLALAFGTGRLWDQAWLGIRTPAPDWQAHHRLPFWRGERHAQSGRKPRKVSAEPVGLLGIRLPLWRDGTAR